MKTPIDWEATRTAAEWKALAQDFAREWSWQNQMLMVDPSYIHWLARTLHDGKLFRIDDQKLRHAYWESLGGTT